MLSDAPLLFPPGQLALAAVRSGLRKVQFWLVLVLLGALESSSCCTEHMGPAPLCPSYAVLQFPPASVLQYGTESALLVEEASQCCRHRYRLQAMLQGPLSRPLGAQVQAALPSWRSP